MMEIDDSDLQRAANLLKEFPGAADRLSKRVVRSSVKGVQREAAQKIAERYTFQKKRISGAMRISYQRSCTRAGWDDCTRLSCTDAERACRCISSYAWE